jgi:hypothetical protein
MFVRLALDTDEDAVVELTRMNVAETMSHHAEIFDDRRVREVFRNYLLRASPTVYVVEERRQVIAFGKFTLSQFDYAYSLFTTLDVIYVRPDKRGTRAAVLLAKEFDRWSDRLGAIESTGGNDNDFKSERTASFLEHFGWQRVGFFMRRIRSGYRGEEGRR